jgi:hypothetical protein
MNERIKQLAEQAGIQFPKHLIEGVNGPGVVSPKDKLAKFAELIVREMLQTCEDHPAWTGRMIGEQIKQHFGVEE